MTWIELAILSLAVWRASHMVVWEDGPFFVFRNIRRRLRANEFGGPTLDAELLSQEELEEAMRSLADERSFAGELLSCVWCLSMWVAAVAIAAFILWPPALYWMAILAISAAAVIVESLLRRC